MFRKNFKPEKWKIWKISSHKVRVHRVYGIQNDRLGLMINVFFTVFKTIHQSQKNLQNTAEKRTEKQKKNANI